MSKRRIDERLETSNKVTLKEAMRPRSSGLSMWIQAFTYLNRKENALVIRMCRPLGVALQVVLIFKYLIHLLVSYLFINNFKTVTIKLK